MNLIVIHNPAAGGGSWTAKRVKRVLRSAGHTIILSSAKRKWRDLMRESPDAFVAAGGDGTVHEVIHALGGRDVPVAIMPTGTANNIAHAVGFRAGDDLATRITRWRDNKTLLQIPSVQSNGEEEAFLEAVGAGVFAKMIRDSEDIIYKDAAAVGLLAIRKELVERLLRAKPVHVTTNIDGKSTEGEYLLLECMNVPTYGPRLRLAAAEAADAATVSVCAITPDEREIAAQWMATGECDRDWAIGRGTSVEIVTEGRTHVDGALWQKRVARASPLRICAGTRTAEVWV